MMETYVELCYQPNAYTKLINKLFVGKLNTQTLIISVNRLKITSIIVFLFLSQIALIKIIIFYVDFPLQMSVLKLKLITALFLHQKSAGIHFL